MLAWKKFSKTKSGYLLTLFLTKLNHEIADAAERPGKREAVLVLNTRKGYWVYKVFERGEKKKIRAIRVFSDRYAKKVLDFSELKDKYIYLVDDTLTNGYSLLETFQLLAKVIDVKYICPLVFALSDTVDLEEKRRKTSGIEQEFWKKLKYFATMSDADIGKLCIQETKLLHEEGIPFVIDLPFFKDVNAAASDMDFQIRMTKKQFEQLEKGSDKWIFHKNEYKLQNEQFLQGFIIQMNHESLLEATKQYASDFVIEGTYTFDEDGNLKVVFIPFAILNSMNKEFLDGLWRELCQEICGLVTETEAVSEQLLEMNGWVAKYRECVYLLSMLIAQEFRIYLKELLGIELTYDYEIMKNHFPEKFISAIKVLERDMEKDPGILLEKVSRGVRRKNTYVLEAETDGKAENKVFYSEKAAYEIVSEKLEDKKETFKSILAKYGKTLFIPEEILTIEEIQQLLDRHFVYQSGSERRYALTRVIITMLNLSTCSNKLRKSKDGTGILRGLRYGENSDLLLPFFDIYFYWAVILFHKIVPKKDHLKEYEDFTEDLKQFYVDCHLFEQGRTEDGFEANRAYYRKVMKDDSKIMNKYYFLQPYLSREADEAEIACMKKMETLFSEYE